jgi:hypothetical protein
MTDTIDEIRARHAATENSCLAPGGMLEREGKRAHADRDTLLRLLDAERARRVKAESRVIELNELRIWAHETLMEINICNYDHDDVCRLNDAAVEVILGLNYVSLDPATNKDTQDE